MCFAYKILMLEDAIDWEKIDKFVDPNNGKRTSKLLPSKSSLNSLVSGNYLEERKNQKLKALDEKAAMVEARMIWQNRWRKKCALLRSPLILSNILMRSLCDYSYRM